MAAFQWHRVRAEPDSARLANSDHVKTCEGSPVLKAWEDSSYVLGSNRAQQAHFCSCLTDLYEKLLAVYVTVMVDPVSGQLLMSCLQMPSCTCAPHLDKDISCDPLSGGHGNRTWGSS